MSSPDFRIEGRDKKQKKFCWAGLIENPEVTTPGIEVSETVSESVQVTGTSS